MVADPSYLTKSEHQLTVLIDSFFADKSHWQSTITSIFPPPVKPTAPMKAPAQRGMIQSPSLIYKVEPEYTEEAKSAGLQGTVVLYAEVSPEGRAMNIRVVRGLGLGLDEKAIEAIRKWRFRPGTKDGSPIPVATTIEVNFRFL
jgi:TonB family protein